jgi:hypothetical protein
MSGNIPYGPLIPVEGLCRMLLSCHLEGFLDISALSQLLYDLIIVSYFLWCSLSYDFMRSIEIPLNKFIHFLVSISLLATQRSASPARAVSNGTLPADQTSCEPNHTRSAST